MKLYDLTDEELTDGPLARKAVEAGYSSLRAAANENNWWGTAVEEVEKIISAPHQG